jgi:hypothetical protein
MLEETEEKRRYFRVHDTINLFHKEIDEADLDKLSHISNDVLNSCSLTAALEVLSAETRSLFPRLERRDQELADYLKILETKISLIAQAINNQDNNFLEHNSLGVIMSATGLVFTNQHVIPVGKILELRMLLTSCMAVIVAYARVVRCFDNPDEDSDGPFSICVEYINLKDDIRELLIKHVVKTQMQQLRDKFHE